MVGLFGEVGGGGEGCGGVRRVVVFGRWEVRVMNARSIRGLEGADAGHLSFHSSSDLDHRVDRVLGTQPYPPGY